MTSSSYRNPGSSQTINYQSDTDPSLPPGIPAEANALCFRSDIPSLYAHNGPLDTDWTLVGSSASESSFALLNYDWEANTVDGQKNIASVEIPLAPNGSPYVGIRWFHFNTPVDGSLTRAVITIEIEGEVIPAAIPEPPGVQGPPTVIRHSLIGWGELLDANTLQVVVARSNTLDGDPSNFASLSDEAVRVNARIDLVPILFTLP